MRQNDFDVTEDGIAREPEPRVIEINLPEDNLVGKRPITAKEMLYMMQRRQEVLGSPLPENFVPPPGIDIEALLKLLPPKTR